MADAFYGEIRMFAGTFAPANWNFCDGTLLSIRMYTALFGLLGVRYGGDGKTTFALPDLRGRILLSQGQSPGTSTYTLAQKGGVEQITLNSLQFPSHNHNVQANGAEVTTPSPKGAYPGSSGSMSSYASNTAAGPVYMSTTSVGAGGGGPNGVTQPHSNLMPFLVVNYIICLYGEEYPINPN